MQLDLSNTFKLKVKTPEENQPNKKPFWTWTIILTIALSIVITVTATAAIAVKLDFDFGWTNKTQPEQTANPKKQNRK